MIVLASKIMAFGVWNEQAWERTYPLGAVHVLERISE
jgi:hypothetical protein